MGWGTWDEMLETIDVAVGTGPYLLGETFSMADMLFGGTIGWMMMFGMLPKKPSWEAYVGRLEERPARVRAKEISESYPACTRASRTRFLVEGAQGPIPFDKGRMEPTFDLDCDGEFTLGPLDGKMWTSFTFEVEEATNLRLQAPFATDSDDLALACPSTELEVIDCARGCLADPDLYIPWWSGANGPGSFTDETRAFQPGRYLVRLSRDVDDPGPSCVRITEG